MKKMVIALMLGIVGTSAFAADIKVNMLNIGTDKQAMVFEPAFVKAKVALEEMDEGQVLAVKMNDGEPVQNVPRSIKEEGHQILKLDTNDDGTYTLFVKKVGE